MLQNNVTVWDLLYIIQSLIIIIAIYIAYKKGEQHGEEKNPYIKKFKTQNHKKRRSRKSQKYLNPAPIYRTKHSRSAKV